ncbi:hypothetical protein BHE90_003104 [Fusarium euwallaceae]|uniref:Uncharacterized protein n=1 Tax=Fusarium euwallaceae TaxID=1147111 RepID=A0A430M343_9HYPO|nr:hypothetical protein BHE90_003104 [Fusarium euwallaceae]
MSEPEPLRLFDELKNKISEYDGIFGNILSPKVAHEKKTATIRARIAELWAQLPKIQPTEAWKVQEEIVELGGQLREAEMKFEGDLESREALYRQRLETAFDSLSDDLMKIMELRPTFGEPRIQGQATLREPSVQGRPTLREASIQNQATVREPSVREPSVQVQPTLREPSVQDQQTSRESSVQVQPALREPSTQDQPTVREPSIQEQQTSREPSLQVQGTKRTLDESTAPCRNKRRKLFRNKTEKAVRRPLQNRRRRGKDDPPEQHGSEGITNPVPGDLYCAYRDRTNEWIPVVLLPMTNLEQAGIPGTLESLGLADALPSCYEKDEVTGEYTWAEGYKNWQPHVAEREFPVMYFDKRFPVNSPVGWVAAEELREFNVATATFALVPHLRIIRKFLRKRDLGEPYDSGHDRDGSPDEDESQHSAQNRPEQIVGEPVASEIVVAPLWNRARPISGATSEAQPRPRTSRSTVRFESGTALQDEPNESTPTNSTQLEPTTTTETRQTRQRSTQPVASAVEARPTRQTSTSNVSTTAAEAQPTPQQTPALDATTSTETPTATESIRDPTPIFDPDTSTDEIREPIKPERDIEIISIASSDSEPEEESNQVTGLHYTTARLQPETQNPERQAHIVEDARLERNSEERPHQRTENQTQHQKATHPGKVPTNNILQERRQAMEIRRAAAIANSYAAHGSDRAIPVPDRSRHQYEATTARPHTSGHPGVPAPPGTQRYYHHSQAEAANLAMATLRHPNSGPSAYPQHHEQQPQYIHVQQHSTAGSLPTIQNPNASHNQGSTHTNQVPPNQFTSVNAGAPSNPPATHTNSTFLPPPGSRPTRGPDNRSNNDLSNYGFIPTERPITVPPSTTALVNRAPPAPDSYQSLSQYDKWWYTLPDSLIKYLEEYLRKKNVPVSPVGLMNGDGRFICPFCPLHKKTAYVRVPSFVSHLGRHWETAESYVAKGGVVP